MTNRSRPLGIKRSCVVSALLTIAAVGATTKSRGDELPPIVTPQNAASLADKPARLEATIVEIKFAMRRQMHFLSAAANFRSETNIPIAIRQGDFPRFEAKGLRDLSAHYLGKKVQARGTVLRDEGQWLLVVNAPDDIQIQDVAGKPAATSELTIVGATGKTTLLSVPLPADLPRSKVTVEHDGKRDEYEGVPLATILERAGVPLGAEARGGLLGRYIVVRAQDKYAAVFSVAEIDPFYVDRPALLAERVNGQSLPENRAGLQIVMPGEKHRRRWVGQVIRIEVRNAFESSDSGKP